MLAGGRDIVLGSLPFLFRDQRPALRHAVAAGAATDALDAVGLGVMALRRRELGRAGVVGAASGGAAAIAGAWAARRLSG